jgi:ABC-type transport system involved in multi-copper enzyme maturation permease subunit
MFTIFKKSFKDKRTSLIVYSLVGIIILIIYILFQPSMTENLETYQDLLKVVPQEFLKAFNADINSFSGSLESTLATKQLGLIWPLITIIFSTTIAATSFAGEVEKRTFSLLLSQPVSRAKIFWGKYLAGLLILFIYVVCTVPITILIAPIFNQEVDQSLFLKFTIEAFLFVVAFYSLATSVSVFVSETGKVFALGIGLCLGMYIIKVMSLLVAELDGLKFFSAFYYYDPTRSLINGDLLPEGLLLFLSVSIASVFTAYYRFIKRDIGV